MAMSWVHLKSLNKLTKGALSWVEGALLLSWLWKQHVLFQRTLLELCGTFGCENSLRMVLHIPSGNKTWQSNIIYK